MFKKIARYLAVAAALAVSSTAAAQFRWGPTAGVDMTSLVFKQDLVSVSGTVGAQAGVQGELMFPGIGFGIDFGLMYAQQGARVNLGEKEIWSSLGYTDPRCLMHSIQIPVDLRFKWTRMLGFEDYIAPYVFGGPVISIQAAHSHVDAMKYSGGDIGLQCGLGVELFKHWQVQGSYCWGMTYAMKTKLLDDFSARNRTWSIRVTYLF